MSALEQTSAIEIKETRISFSESGKGEPILFLHGNPGSRRDFSAILADANAPACHMVMPDRPGHNGSEELLNESNDPWLDTNVYAEFIDRRCNGKTWLFGYSMGCNIACRIAIKFPDKVKGIIMAAPYLVPDKPSEKPSSLPDLAHGAILGTALGLLLPLLSQTKMTQHLEKVFAPGSLSEDYRDTWLPRYTRFESLMAMMIDKNAMLRTIGDVEAGLDKISCPVIVLSGEQDSVCSAENQKKFLTSKLPGARIINISDAGHALPLTHPQECLKIIAEVLCGK
ncbi:MAG TPA: alpha/beta hydrolase [Candidatus Rifleibacterium sp.]|nr:alpha/beta hydrolase [Candidatus Rifleibacterium sp.]HPT44597.1 alpha/beta hydrolase [Candidatus Rifleibacterium sp.]